MKVSKVIQTIKKKHLNDLIGFYTITKKDFGGLIKAKFHKSDVPIEEKHPDFFIDKINKLKVWYTPFMAKTQYTKRGYENWGINFGYYCDFENIHNFIMAKYYPKEDFQPLTKKLLQNIKIKNKLDVYIKDLVDTQSSYYDNYKRTFGFSSRKTIRKSIILVPKDYNSIYWFPKEEVFRIGSLFDFEAVTKFNKKTPLVIFCDEELFAYNITENTFVQFKTKEQLKEYLIEKGIKCVRF